MARDDEFEVRPGRIRQGGARSGTALRQILGSVQRAGGPGGEGIGRRSVFGRGRAGGVRAVHRLGAGHRAVVVKARVVRRRPVGGSLSSHLRYLQRDGVTRDGEGGRLFNVEADLADPRAFAARCDEDRHHFRFIVSPEDGAELQDLRAYTRDLMRACEIDLATGLDWVAVEHWNTAHPHIHVLVRGVADDGSDLVISRDYITRGFRARACQLAMRELGPRTAHDIQQALMRDVSRDRWTRLDGLLVREAALTDRRLDLRPGGDRADPGRALRIARLETLQDLGLAQREATGLWRLAPDVETTLKAMGRRNDIIARMHNGLAASGTERAVERMAQDETVTRPLTARVLAQGLDDELKGSGYLVLDGLDGRVHHHQVRDLADLDLRVGAVVDLAPFKGETGSGRMSVFVRSDLSIEDQVSAGGATWLDRRLLHPTPKLRTPGFAEAVASALERRIDHLQSLGLAHRDGDRVRLAPGLLETLRRSELETAGRRVSKETGLPYRPLHEGETVSGDYRRRLSLASGRFAMIDDGLGFSLVPWRPALERSLGRPVTGRVGPGQTIDWSVGRTRGSGR